MRMLGTAILVLVVVAALGARALPFDPVQLDLSQALDPPTWSHPLGTDELGRDLRRAVRVRGGTRGRRGDAGGERRALVSGRIDGAAAGGPGGPGRDQSD